MAELPDIPTLAELHALEPRQQPGYDDAAEVAEVVARLRTLPPLVFAGECDSLRSKMASVAAGEAFVLQGGDCAETFDGVTADNIQGKLRTLLSMAVVLTYAAQVPIVKVGRMAGQYAKPRSSGIETRGEVTLPAYRGDAVNGFALHRGGPPARSAAAARGLQRLGRHLEPDPCLRHRRLRPPAQRAHLERGLRQDLGRRRAVPDAGQRDRPSAGLHGGLRHRRRRVQHRRLLLQPRGAEPGVRARDDPDRLPDPLPYNVSGHLLWIGERTRQLEGAHVELLRHVRNPLGVKLGPTTTADTALELADRLDPDHEPGRITFITRMGAHRIRDLLPDVVAKVTASGRQVAWVCDPMHGNTFEAVNGYKTRAFSDVMDELNGFFDVHEELGTWPGGVHVELTGDDVTECVGGVGRPGRGRSGEPVRDAVRPAAEPQPVAGAGLPGGRAADHGADPAAESGAGVRPGHLLSHVIDLRSDTVTVPTPAMREAMLAAPVGDDVYGEDPTISELERRTAGCSVTRPACSAPPGRWPTCSASGCWSSRPGGGLRRRRPHRPGRDGGACCRARPDHADVGSVDGLVDVDAYAAVVAPSAGRTWSRPQRSRWRTRTTSAAAPSSRTTGWRARASCAARRAGYHLDGARLWNAHVATGVPLVDYGSLFDTVSVCFSKGLGAPVGSVLVSTAANIAQRQGVAQTARRRLAPGRHARRRALHALEQHVERLADDHGGARRSPRRWPSAPAAVDPAAVQTNIVVLDTGDASQLPRSPPPRWRRRSGCRLSGRACCGPSPTSGWRWRTLGPPVRSSVGSSADRSRCSRRPQAVNV